MSSPEDLAKEAAERLRALRSNDASLAARMKPLVGAGQLEEGLLLLARAKLAEGDPKSAADMFDLILDLLPASHPQRGALAALAASAHVAAQELEPDEPDHASPVGTLLMAAQDGELTPSKVAGLEDRLVAADPLLRVEWAWLERARTALSLVDVAPLTAAAEAQLLDGLRARLGPATPATPGTPFATQRALLAERLRALVEQQRAADGADPLVVDPFAAGSGDPFDARPAAALGWHAEAQEQRQRLEEERRQVEQAHRNLEAKLAQVNRQFAAEKQAFLREKQAFLRERQASGLVARPGPGVVRRGTIEVAGLHVAAPGEPSGDLFDLVERDAGVDVLIGDASGRGAKSVAAAGLTRASVHAALALGAEPTAALVATNRALKRMLPVGVFVAASLVRWDEARGRAVIAGAGHEDAIVYRASGRRVERLRTGGVVLGAVEDVPAFTPREVELAPGDALVLVSDGVTEAPGRDGEPFCDPAWTSLLGVVATHGHLDAAGLAGAVRDAVQAWREQAPEDDVVIVALRRGPAAPDPKVATVISMLGLDALFRP